MSSSRQPREGNCIVPILQMEKLKLPETKDIPESHRSRWQSWIGPGSLTLGRLWGSLATAPPWPALGIIMALEGHHGPGLLEGRGHLLHLRVSQVPFGLAYSQGLMHVAGVVEFLKRPRGKLGVSTSNCSTKVSGVSRGQRLFPCFQGVTPRKGGASRSPGRVPSSPPPR